MSVCPPPQLSLRAVNSSRSAFASFLFAPLFFQLYEASGPPPHLELCRCKVLMKSFLGVFRSLPSLEKTVGKCLILLKPRASRLVVQLHCKYGESQPPSPPHAPPPEPGKTMVTELWLAEDEFQTAAVAPGSRITFCLKEFRGLLTFAEASNLPLPIHYDVPGRPVIFTLEDAVLEVHLVLATLSDPESQTSASGGKYLTGIPPVRTQAAPRANTALEGQIQGVETPAPYPVPAGDPNPHPKSAPACPQQPDARWQYLVRPADEVQVVFVQELCHHLCPEGEGNAAVILAPTLHILVGVGPEQVTEQALIRHVRGAHDPSDLLHRLQVGRQPYEKRGAASGPASSATAPVPTGHPQSISTELLSPSSSPRWLLPRSPRQGCAHLRGSRRSSHPR
uniref:RAD9 checkpoint clamp component A n=1 Tax=Buteo japonicus TaxID=224669 RepID=A0A8C0B3T9_9AVES